MMSSSLVFCAAANATLIVLPEAAVLWVTLKPQTVHIHLEHHALYLAMQAALANNTTELPVLEVVACSSITALEDWRFRGLWNTS
jgi:hypothetical protein